MPPPIRSTSVASAPSPKSNEILSLQYLRGLAAAVVILDHAPTAAMNWHFGIIGVDIFFAISGMVMIMSTLRPSSRSVKGAVEFLRRRFFRVVPLYWLFTLLAIPILRLGHQVVTVPALWHSLLFLFYRGNDPVSDRYFPLLGVGWTLNYEVFFYACFAFVLALKTSPYVLIPVLAVLSIPGFLHPLQPIAVLTLLNFRLLEFAAGMIFAWLYMRGLRFPAWLAVVLAVSSVIVFAAGPTRSTAVEAYFWFPLAMVFTFSIISLEPWLALKRVRLLEALGNASYSIYLVHVFFVIWPIKYVLRMPRFAARHLDSSLWMIAFEVAASCGAGYLVHRAVEKPLMRAFGLPIGGRTILERPPHPNEFGTPIRIGDEPRAATS